MSVDRRLLVDTPDALERADIERVLGYAVIRALTLELAVRLLVELGLSSAATCASVGTRPSCALLASSAFSRFFPSRRRVKLRSCYPLKGHLVARFIL